MNLTLLSLLTSFWMILAHPFFISLTEMRYNTSSQKMEVSQKIFWDDLEVSLGKEFGQSVDFLNPKDKAKLNQQLKTYLLKHNQLWVNGKPVPLNYLGYEVEEDAAWFYLESNVAESPKSVEVQNTILLEEFNGQQNIVHVYFQSKSPRSMLLGKGEEKGKVEF